MEQARVRKSGVRWSIRGRVTDIAFNLTPTVSS